MTPTHTCLVCNKPNARIYQERSGGRGESVLTECPDCKAKGTITNMEPWLGRELELDRLESLFNLADIVIIGKPRKLINGYWGEGHHPWWFVKTKMGYIEIGWRKRVISIDWTDTGLEVTATEDDVTKDKHFVRAYSYDDAIKYLRAVGEAINEAQRNAVSFIAS
jgi:hypothetical protein